MRMKPTFVLFIGVAVFNVSGAAAEEWNKFFLQADRSLLAHRYDDAIGNYLGGPDEAQARRLLEMTKK